MEDGLHDFPGGRPLSHHRSHRVQSLGAASRDFPADHHRDPEADVYFPARLCQLNRARRTHPGEVPRSWVLRWVLVSGEDKAEEEAVTQPLALHVPVGTSSTCLPGLDVFGHRFLFLLLYCLPLFLPLSSFLFLLLYFSCLLLLLIPFRPRVSLLLSFCHFCPCVALPFFHLPCLGTASDHLWAWGHLAEGPQGERTIDKWRENARREKCSDCGTGHRRKEKMGCGLTRLRWVPLMVNKPWLTSLI